jgi:hypothetical protein
MSVATGSVSATYRRDQYWASLSPDETTQEVWDRIEAYRRSIKNSQLYPRWVRAFRSRHGLGDANTGEASTITRRGSKGHRAVVKSSVAAVDARHQLSIVSPVIPALDAIPVNTSYKTLSQVREGKRFFDYYVERRGLGKLLYQIAKHCQDFGVGWIVTDWDPFAGPIEPQPELSPASPQPGAEAAPLDAQPAPEVQNNGAAPQPQTTGEIVFSVHTPLTLIEDTNQDSHHDWFICRDKANRWELVARYPNLRTEILDLPSIHDDDQWMAHDFRVEGMERKGDQTDLVAVWTLHHKACRAMPQGRMLRIVSADCWLFDGPYPYPELSRSTMIADPIWNTSMGDSTFHHALGVQAALDRALSANVTNILALGHQLVSIQDENFEIQELSDGVSAIVNKPGPGGEPPRGVTLVANQEETHRTVEVLERYVHMSLGVNSVIRGDPDANIKSGAFAGLLVQQAAQYNSPAQYAFQRCVEDVGNQMLVVLKKFASRPIMGEISGPNGEWRLKQFTQDDFSGIHRLVAKPGNPAEQTAAFKKSKADQLLEAGLITSKSEYDTMVEARSDELGTEDEETEELQMLLENEDMLSFSQGKETIGPMVPSPPPPAPPPQAGPDGMPLPPAPAPPAPVDGQGMPIVCPPVLITDDDAKHVRKHKSVLDSPAARANERLIDTVGAHIRWHLQNAATKPPDLAAILGEMPPAPPAPPPGAVPPAPRRGPPPPRNGAPKGPGGVQAVRPVVPPPEATPPAGPVAP